MGFVLKLLVCYEVKTRAFIPIFHSFVYAYMTKVIKFYK